MATAAATVIIFPAGLWSVVEGDGAYLFFTIIYFFIAYFLENRTLIRCCIVENVNFLYVSDLLTKRHRKLAAAWLPQITLRGGFGLNYKIFIR